MEIEYNFEFMEEKKHMPLTFYKYQLTLFPSSDLETK